MVDRDPFIIDQCLFGYADGHRLLATSLRLTGDVASDLTAASDIAPGVRFAGSDGYWTGLPVPNLGRYGLMRTWPAPEMPRPGCVWTRLLLFDPALFETVDDLSSLTALLRRPATSDDHADYGRPLAFFPSDAPTGLVHSADHDRGHLAEILGVLYAGLEGPVEMSRPSELDDLVMAVWSQQWPRLRRNFRFQTAATTGTEGVSKRFDLQFRIARPPSRDLTIRLGGESMWLDVASNDIWTSSNHPLRAFLRRYGQDVKRQRGSFRPLVEVFAISTSMDGASANNVPESLTRWFPEQDDAATLKRDLMDGVILTDVQVEMVLYLCAVDKGRSLPAPSEFGLRRLAENWQARSFDLMRLAEWAATEQGELADVILLTVARIVPPADFWSATESFPEMRRRMVGDQPDLLNADAVVSLQSETLLSLIDVVPFDHEVGGALVRRLSSIVDRGVVTKALHRFPTGVLLEAIQTANESGVDASKAWLREVGSVPSRILSPSIMATVRRASILVAIAEALDWLSNDVIQGGLEPWLAGLAVAQDDLAQWDRDRLEAFLFALAVTVGGPPAQQVFERSFGYLHSRMTSSYLSWKAQQMLDTKMPSLGWGDWDKALRLRLAVVQAYVQFNLDSRSFGRLSQDRKERKLLRRAAEEVNGADRFISVLID